MKRLKTIIQKHKMGSQVHDKLHENLLISKC